MNEYFSLQRRMTHRRIQDLGAIPWLVYIAFPLLFVGISWFLFYKTEMAGYIYVALAVLFMGPLSEIKRVEFLKMTFDRLSFKKIRLLENNLVSLPFALFLLYQHHYYHVITLILLSIVLALVHVNTSFNLTVRTPFSKRPFEFTSGFRNTFFLIIAAYALLIIGISVQNFNLGIFALMLLFATSLSYYSKPEHVYFVWIFDQSPKDFLYAKIKTALLHSALLTLPMAVTLSLFFPQNIWIILLFFIIGWAFLVFMIVAKYSVYPDDMTLLQGILLALCIWFPPVLLFLIPYLFKKSEHRLRKFLP